MPRETTYLPVSGDDAFLGAAGYFAVLAYPDDLDRRDRFVAAVKALVFKYSMNGQLKRRIIKREDILAFSKERELNAAINHALNIIMKKRMPAWHIALHSMMNHAAPVRMADGSKFSINKMIEQKFPESDLGSGDMVNRIKGYNRYWSPSKSVVHLMFGLQNHFPETGDNFHVDGLFLKLDWVPEAIENAENVRKTLCILDGINITDADTIQLLAKE